MKTSALVCVSVLLATTSMAQPAGAPQSPATTSASSSASGSVLIRHGHVYTVSAAGTLPDADILIANGRIAAVGANLPQPAGVAVTDAHGKPVTPGLMASYTQIGIEEVQLVHDANDADADQTTDTAAFDVADAINPNSTLIPVARIAGVTRALTVPDLGSGVFFGQAAVINLGNGPDILDKRAAGVLATLDSENSPHQTRPDIWAKFRETIDDAREYWAQRARYHAPGGSRDQRSERIDLDALGPVIRGEEPLIVQVARASDIRQVIAYARAQKLKLVILGGDEGWMVAKDIADANVPVIVDAEENLPEHFSNIGSTLRNAARLDAAGVTVVFMPQSDDPSQYARTLAQMAGNAVANGMNWDHALAAITRNPAAVWGIGDRYGTLEVGKDADVVVWDGDPLNLSAPQAVFIKGARIPLVSRQTMLRDRYRDLNRKDLPFAYR
jgi:imidazolonepropionase-like amidohydrolase